MTSSRHNPLRSYRFLVPGILAVVLGAGGRLPLRRQQQTPRGAMRAS